MSLLTSSILEETLHFEDNAIHANVSHYLNHPFADNEVESSNTVARPLHGGGVEDSSTYTGAVDDKGLMARARATHLSRKGPGVACCVVFGYSRSEPRGKSNNNAETVRCSDTD